MSVSRFTAAVALPLLISAAPVSGRSASDIIATPAPADAVAPPVSADCNCINIPALTPIELIIDANIGSKISKTGDTFPFRLAKPIIVEGREALAAGTIGQGEVVHAKKYGSMGAAGEFVAAARYLQVGDRRLRLRSLQLTLTGGDQTESRQLGALISAIAGKYDSRNPDVVVAAGTVVAAKTAEPFTIDAGVQK